MRTDHKGSLHGLVWEPLVTSWVVGAFLVNYGLFFKDQAIGGEVHVDMRTVHRGSLHGLVWEPQVTSWVVDAFLVTYGLSLKDKAIGGEESCCYAH